MAARLAVVVLAAAVVGGSVAGAAQPPAISTFAGVGAAGFSGDGGPAHDARLASPLGLAVDPQGDVYIADSGNDRVREVTPAGRISTFAQAPHPTAVAVDGQGNVLVATGDNRVLKLSP